MFIVTIPCDLHKRLEKSTSTLPPLHCTLPHTPLPPPIPQSTTKEAGVREGEIKSKFVVKRSRIAALSACYWLRSLLDKHSVVLRRNKEWQKLVEIVGVACMHGYERRDTVATSRWSTILMLFLFFFVVAAKITQKPNHNAKENDKKIPVFCCLL